MARRLAGHAIDLESRATIVVRLSKSRTHNTIRPNTNHTLRAVLRNCYLPRLLSEVTETCEAPLYRNN
ncbi:hypothetical protein Pla52n_06430 [Stieleria varia]|uniref:Uncharacterized protein n=1 Tax=Stieleria varia TaxID=2528005 RepID=A0A5C6B8U2_9BACT|nr:hypothetical protein Pla52n_06430 [Stieleria varia]